ncbi:glycoside hydrolase family 2 protein [Roseiflexus sp.]|uniref:glycoside hydrolase family 2 protein n=1 Tax=Roseiflexus sp. TaxID=2562120 RepID=UPI00398A58A9
MLSYHMPLPGRWEFRFDEQSDWRPIAVPGSWEDAGFPKDRAGPAWYRTSFVIPPELEGRRLFLRFGAVSYHCEAFIVRDSGDMHSIGTHTGMWDAFDLAIGDAAAPGEHVTLLVQVEKPASLTDGPDSASLPGRFPLRETLAGFLPYVWGHSYGGIWQDVTLIASGATRFLDAWVHGTPDGHVFVEAELDGPARVTLELYRPDGRFILSAEEDAVHVETASGVRYQLHMDGPTPDPHLWSPDDPALYRAVLRAGHHDQVTLQFGLRSFEADGATLRLNSAPIYPRMILSWGWRWETFTPNPGPERVRADFERLKRMGYNGIKCCLWFPPTYYFDLADEMGMLLWIELPMWLPRVTDHFRRQTPVEYERLIRQARRHPSVVIYSLGCELGRDVGADILGSLYAMTRSMCGDALVRDNSGSGEAYGGLLNEFAQYYDYHFYADLHFFRHLLDAFAPRWRPEQPWLFGEYCDYDTFRDLRRYRHTDGSRPWWLSADPAVNPTGARWTNEAPLLEERLRAQGLWERSAELEVLSYAHGLLHRKWTIETTRTYRDVSGYVITGEADTPITSAGMWDATGALKYDPAEFRRFNNDLVALIGWDRRRDWVRGGDRAAFWDVWSYSAGTLVRPHIIASHYGAQPGQAHAAWSIAFDDEAPFASGDIVTDRDILPGDVREIGVAEFTAPDVSSPRRATLRVTLRVGAQTTENAWFLWFFPANPWAAIHNLAIYDPLGRLHDLARLAPQAIEVTHTDLRGDAGAQVDLHAAPFVVVASAWTRALSAYTRGGGHVVLLQDGDGPPGPVATAVMPFWREALRICEPHPAWGDFPHDGWAELQFFGCAADCALDTQPFGILAHPILRRIDTRTAHVHDYAAEVTWGEGRLITSTLRIYGGAGEQPSGIGRNTAAAYLLLCWVTYLQTLNEKR